MSENTLKISPEAVDPASSLLRYSPCEILVQTYPAQNRKGKQAVSLIKYLGNVKNLQLSNFIEGMVYIP